MTKFSESMIGEIIVWRKDRAVAMNGDITEIEIKAQVVGYSATQEMFGIVKRLEVQFIDDSASAYGFAKGDYTKMREY